MNAGQVLFAALVTAFSALLLEMCPPYPIVVSVELVLAPLSARLMVHCLWAPVLKKMKDDLDKLDKYLDNFIPVFCVPITNRVVPLLVTLAVLMHRGDAAFGAEFTHILQLSLVVIVLLVWALQSVHRKSVKDLKDNVSRLFQSWAVLYVAAVIVAVCIAAKNKDVMWRHCKYGYCPHGVVTGMDCLQVFNWTDSGIQDFTTAIAAAPPSSNKAVMVGSSKGLLFTATQIAQLTNASILIIEPVEGPYISNEAWRKGIISLVNNVDVLVWPVVAVTGFTFNETDKVFSVNYLTVEGHHNSEPANAVLIGVGAVKEGCAAPPGDPCHQHWRSYVDLALGFVCTWIADWLYYGMRGKEMW